MITSDKAYKNLEIKRGYVENDTLKGIIEGKEAFSIRVK